MSTGTVEYAEELSSAALDAVPSCEVDHWGEPCGNPSVARVRFTCRTCGLRIVIFTCRRDLDDILAHKSSVKCSVCWTSNYEHAAS